MADSASPKKIVSAPEAVPPLPVFSQAVISKGFVYLSGNIGCDNNLKVVEGGIVAETRAALENITKILQASGTSLANVVKVNIYLSNFDRDFVPMNEVYLKFFGTDSPPARTCVGVAALPLKANVEIECVAALPN
ncbi:YjgF-like protein [Macrolepiota fuliginosa MF-IS2]|uniref:YjgF-like protein n=1 Tax=Macrolepiota fuliginosa MF-IS2 TaxID=1400762 RepID=A0A9P5XHA9_9AGAR|nr:YjgF-like protein [Macrolepiota fuliginosa MF-IS2]